MSKEIIELIIPFVTLIIGFFLSSGKEWFFKRKKEKETNELVKVLINLEMERNQSLLTKYWEAVSRSNQKWYYEDTGFSYSHLASFIIKLTLPNFSTEAWKSQLGRVPNVYDKKKLQNIWMSYDYFQQLTELRNHIAAIEQQTQDKVNPMKQEGSHLIANLGYMSFGNNTSHLAASFEMITKKLIGKNTVKFENSEEEI